MRSWSSAVGAAIGLVVCLLWLGASSCSAPAEPTRPKVDTRRPIDFEFVDADGREISSRATRGRATLILLVTTFDMASQLMAQRVNQLLHTTKPRINAGALVMEPPKYGIFVDTYREQLKLDYPVLLADHASLHGRGPFGDIHHIPTLIVLDSKGREVTRFEGRVDEEPISDALAEATR